MAPYVGRLQRDQYGYANFKGSFHGQQFVARQTAGDVFAPDQGSSLHLECTHTAVDGSQTVFDLEAMIVEIYDPKECHVLSCVDPCAKPSVQCTTTTNWRCTEGIEATVDLHLSEVGPTPSL
jgi:hypothetical protein